MIIFDIELTKLSMQSLKIDVKDELIIPKTIKKIKVDKIIIPFLKTLVIQKIFVLFFFDFLPNALNPTIFINHLNYKYEQ